MKITKTTLEKLPLKPGHEVWQYRNNFWSYYYCEEETDIGFTFLGMPGIILKDRPVLLIEKRGYEDESVFNEKIKKTWGDDVEYAIMVMFKND